MNRFINVFSVLLLAVLSFFPVGDINKSALTVKYEFLSCLNEYYINFLTCHICGVSHPTDSQVD